MKCAKNKYASLPKASVASFEAGGSPLVLHFKLADGRLQKIDLQFFMKGAFPRPQIGKVCAEIFWLETQRSAQATRKNIKRALKVFNAFLDWRAAGGPERQISSTSELTTTLLIEYQAYLETACTLQENSAKNIYTSLTWFLGHLRAHRPEDISPNFRLPGCRFKHYKGSAIAGGVISVNDLKRIADAALKEVHQIREDHRRAMSLLESAASQAGQIGSAKKPKGYWKSLANFMHALVRFEHDHLLILPSGSKLTIRNLAQEAEVSKDTQLSRYRKDQPNGGDYRFPDIVARFNKLRTRKHTRPSGNDLKEEKIQELREIIESLQEKNLLLARANSQLDIRAVELERRCRELEEQNARLRQECLKIVLIVRP